MMASTDQGFQFRVRVLRFSWLYFHLPSPHFQGPGDFRDPYLDQEEGSGNDHVDVTAPEDNAGGHVGGLELDTLERKRQGFEGQTIGYES
jgi:hypothetical protein